MMGSALLLGYASQTSSPAHAEMGKAYVHGMLGYSFATGSDAKVHNTRRRDIGDYRSQSGWGKGRGTPAMPQKVEIKPSGDITGGGSVGFMFNDMFAVELELSRWSASTEELKIDDDKYKASMSSLALFGNVLANIPTEAKFTPYAGIGVGPNFITAKASGPRAKEKSKNATSLAMQAIGGVAFEISPQVDLTTDYRFVTTFGRSDAKFGSIQIDGVTVPDAHKVQAGVRFKF